MESVPYVDDFGGAAGPEVQQANNEYIQLKTWLLELGLNIAWEKCLSPDTTMTWVGTTFDTILMIIEQLKIQEALDLCDYYINQVAINFKLLESLAGKLMYAAKLSNAARRFTNRILHFRREIGDTGYYKIPDEVNGTAPSSQITMAGQ